MVAKKLQTHTVLYNLGQHQIKFMNASHISSFQPSFAASFGGWIDTINLPPPTWKDEIFPYTGDQCSGFISASDQTNRVIVLTAARIKIKPNTHDFIQNKLVLPPELCGMEWTVDIKGVSNGKISRKSKINLVQLVASTSANHCPVITSVQPVTPYPPTTDHSPATTIPTITG
uniref:Uncharacterized protein n=1 Tax=Cucumis sativus TaxID=3659 RepID=A0A0A0K504_CUCSA